MVTLVALATAVQQADAQSRPPGRLPFGVGEQKIYDVRFGALKVGTARMEVLGIDTVRGRDAYHILFTVDGGVPLFRVHDRYESWIDTATLASLRFKQKIHEGGYRRESVYEIYPERGEYQEAGDSVRPSVRDPLDDGSFVYFVRTVPVEVGNTYEFDRYFKPDRNPVILRALRKETIQVPAGRFDAVVIKPTIKTRGVFSENGRAELWFSDDDRRVLVQMKSNLKIGSLNLYLKSYRPPKTDNAVEP